MLSVNGIYEEGKIKLLQKVDKHKRSKVIVTFVEDIAEPMEEIITRNFAAQAQGLAFWEDDAENIYQDYLPKLKK